MCAPRLLYQIADFVMRILSSKKISGKLDMASIPLVSFLRPISLPRAQSVHSLHRRIATQAHLHQEGIDPPPVHYEFERLT